MSISIGNDYVFQTMTLNAQSAAKTSKLEDSLAAAGTAATDEELMESCKAFEGYLVEQIIKRMKDTIGKSEDSEDEYISYFGDMLYQEYAENIVESGRLGIAKQLYESMKRDQNIL